MVKMLPHIRKLFKKSWPLFSRLPEKQDRHDPSMPSNNMDELALREEFKKRFLGPFVLNVAIELQEEKTAPPLAAVKLAPLAFPVMAVLELSGLGAGVLMAAAGIVTVRYAFCAAPRLEKAFAEAAAEIIQTPNLNNAPRPSAIDAWMARHSQHIPDYLDRLDRREEDLRKRNKILDRLETLGPQAVVTKADRELLRRYDPQHFRTRAENPCAALPHESILGNWHITQLNNAIRKDINRRAGAEGNLWRQMLSINRPR